MGARNSRGGRLDYDDTVFRDPHESALEMGASAMTQGAGACPEPPDERADRILGDGPEDNARVPVLMAPLPAKTTSPRSGIRIPLSPTSAVQLAITIGLCGGYLDLFLMLFRDLWWVDVWNHRFGRDFLW